MRKPLATKIIGLAVLYCAIFCILVIIQFSNQGNFSLTAGSMTIKGHYSDEPIEAQTSSDENIRSISGGIKIFYGGLEFSLKQERGKGLMLTNTDSARSAVNPEAMILNNNIARFILPGGTIITFTSFDSVRGPELQISAEFSEDMSEIIIPLVPRRSSLIQDSGQLGIMYSGSRYVFSSLGQELENGSLTLSRDNAFISYRSRGRQRAFDPEDYIITQVQNYTNVLRQWQDSNYIQWNQNAANLQSEDDIIAYLSQTLQRGSYSAAVNAISRNFINSARHTYRSSTYLGGMANAYGMFTAIDNERLNNVTRLIRAKSLDILKEEHILDYLFTRSSLVLANEVIDIINNANPSALVSEHCPGLLEVYFDIKRWRSGANNPIEHLTEQMLVLISENMNRDTVNDAVYASSSESNNFEYSLRLGKALFFWADATSNKEWAAIGRSLVSSALSSGNAGKLYNILNPGDYYPRATWLTDAGHWAWTISPAIRATETGGNMNISFTFPVGSSHHVIVRGVRPFLRIQIHGVEWRSDPQFENYDSSGWYYYPDNQILVLKLRHRSSVESIRLIYREAPPPPPPPPPVTTESAEVSVE
jgi:hypothetical protein